MSREKHEQCRGVFGCFDDGDVSPMHDAVGIPQGEGEWGVALEVETVDGHLARIRDRCGGKGLPAGREDDSETKGYQKLLHRLIFSSFAV
jgi:hypothetical protein